MKAAEEGDAESPKSPSAAPIREAQMSPHACRLCHIAVVLVAIGCGGSPTDVSDPSGAYTLATINSKPLPGVVSRSGDRTIELLTSTLMLTADHRFFFSGRMRVTTADGGSDETSEAGSGTWTLRGTIVHFAVETPVDFGANAATWDGRRTLTFDDPSGSVPVIMVFVQ